MNANAYIDLGNSTPDVLVRLMEKATKSIVESVVSAVDVLY